MRDTVKKTLVMALTGAALLLTAFLAGSAPAQAAGTAQVSVVHGIPNTPVNVFVNGKSTLQDFKPGTVAGPLDLAAGSYTVTIFPASNTKGTGTPVIKATATVAGGQELLTRRAPDGRRKADDSRPTRTTSRWSAPARPGSSCGTTPRHPRSTCAPTARWPSPS